MAHQLVVVEAHAIRGARLEGTGAQWYPEVAGLPHAEPGERTSEQWASALAAFGRKLGMWGRVTVAVAPCTAPVLCLDGGTAPLTSGQWDSFARMRMQRLLGRRANLFAQRLAPTGPSVRLCTAMPAALIQAVDRWVRPGLRRVELVPAIALAGFAESIGFVAIRCSAASQIARIDRGVGASTTGLRNDDRVITALGAPFPTSTESESECLRLEVRRLERVSGRCVDGATDGIVRVVDLCPPPRSVSEMDFAALIRRLDVSGNASPAATRALA